MTLDEAEELVLDVSYLPEAIDYMITKELSNLCIIKPTWALFSENEIRKSIWKHASHLKEKYE